MSDTQPRDIAGQFTTTGGTAPELTLAREPDAEALRGTLEDFLSGCLPGFGFQIEEQNIEFAVDHLLTELLEAHQR